MSDTIAAIATGDQVAAIGIVRLSGPESIAIVDRLFRPVGGRSMTQARDRSLVFGDLVDREGRILDQCLCTISHGPSSYTGEDTAELQCHGSPVVLRSALEEIFALGARHALPGEFTKRAFVNGRMDLTAAEAVADIIDAETIDYARNAAGQLTGAVSRKTERIYSALADISSHYHAVLDYPDEDIEDFRMQAYEKSLLDAIDELKTMLSSFDRGRLMRSGIPAAIIGRPNAGKSSLLNALLGYDRAIVSSVPGTTRDTIEEKIQLGGVSLRLTDTAGIRDTEDRVEQLGVERSRRAVEAAQLVIAVIDGSQGADPEEAELLSLAEKAPKGLVVISKADLERRHGELKTKLPVVAVSAVTGEGLEGLGDELRELFPMPQCPAGEILTNARQADAVKRALESLEAAKAAMSLGMTPDIVLTETEGAMDALGQLSGRSLREDITDRIFQRFCVGK